MAGKPVAGADASTGSLPLGPPGVRSLLNRCHLPMAQQGWGWGPGVGWQGSSPQGTESLLCSQPAMGVALRPRLVKPLQGAFGWLVLWTSFSPVPASQAEP